jgi:hypothetical protein
LRALIPDAGLAESIALRPVADTSLIEIAPSNNNGGQAWVLAGTTQNFTRNRGLFRFDFGADIPNGALIQSVSLQLEVTRQPSDGFNPAPFGLHRMLRPWGEGNSVATDNSGGMGAPAQPGEATWNQRFAFTSQTWGAPGGAVDIDYVAEASTVENIYGVGDSPYLFPSSSTLVADVQGWVNDPASNFGWMLRCQTEDINFTARRFGSREGQDVAPLLFVEFTVVPEPAPWALGLMGIAILGRKALTHRARSSARAQANS